MKFTASHNRLLTQWHHVSQILQGVPITCNSQEMIVVVYGYQSDEINSDILECIYPFAYPKWLHIGKLYLKCEGIVY